MTREDFNRAMERIMVFYQRPTSPEAVEDFQSYMGGLFDAVRMMEHHLFDETCKELVKTLARGQKPMPSQFWAVYHKFSVERAVAQKQGPPAKEPGEDHFRMLEDAKRMGPKGAQFVLSILSETGRNVPEDVFGVLLERSTQIVGQPETSLTTASSTCGQNVK